MYKNLCKKYNITPKDINEFIDFICCKNSLGDWCGSIEVLLACMELMVSGDIKGEETDGN